MPSFETLAGHTLSLLSQWAPALLQYHLSAGTFSLLKQQSSSSRGSFFHLRVLSRLLPKSLSRGISVFMTTLYLGLSPPPPAPWWFLFPFSFLLWTDAPWYRPALWLTFPPTLLCVHDAPVTPPCLRSEPPGFQCHPPDLDQSCYASSRIVRGWPRTKEASRQAFPDSLISAKALHTQHIAVSIVPERNCSKLTWSLFSSSSQILISFKLFLHAIFLNILGIYTLSPTT